MPNAKLTLSRKALILVAIPLSFQLAFALVLVRLQTDAAKAERSATHTKEVIAHAHEIHTAVSDAHGAARGYVITHDASFLAPFRDARRILPARFDHLDLLVADYPAQVERARELRAAAYAVFAWHAETERLADAAGDAADRERTGQGRATMEGFRGAFSRFVSEEDRLDGLRVTALERSRRQLNAVFVLGGLTAVTCSLLAAYAFYRGIAARFALLEQNTRRLAAGQGLEPVTGTDEIARLDQAFRSIAAELFRASDEIRDLYDSAPCGYHSVDPSGTVVAANRTELQWLGYETAEVIGRVRFVDLVAPASRTTYAETFARVRDRGSASDVELELVRKDRTTFPVLLNSSAVRDGEGRFVRSRTTLTDLSERKRAEAATRLFADLARNIPIGLLIYQLDGDTLVVRSANAEAARLLGIDLDLSLGRPVKQVFPAVPDEQLGRYSAVASSGVADDLGEFRYGDGRVVERWWAVLAFPLPDRSVGVAFQDISARKRAEAEVRSLNEDLEVRVRSRTAELEAANRDLAHKNAENEMFVYSVSHDLRSPLVNLQGFSKELEKGCTGLTALLDEEGVPPPVRDQARTLLDGKMAKSLGFIQSAVLRLSGIIDALLRLSRAGRVEYRWEVVDVSQVVAQVVAASQATIAERGAVVRAGDLPPVWGDRTALSQLFGNLIGNALTYLDPSRPGVIEVTTLPGAVAGLRTYLVRDNGLGIAEAHRGKIFQAFQRAHPGVGSGEGLGLAIVTRVTERHGGRAWVESAPGMGSTFFVTLPTPPVGWA